MTHQLDRLEYWYPKLLNTGIRMPRTVIVPCQQQDIWTGEIDGLMASLKEAARQFSYPIFMKTDLCAGKHDWKNTCFVQDENQLEKNLYALAEFNEIAGGALGYPYNNIILREFLDLDTSFIAFPGDMPINKERRYFVAHGEVVCHHPYWPEEAFKNVSDPDWRSKLAELNYEHQDEVELLTRWAQKVSCALPGYWSVDFAVTKKGLWYLIDMATGKNSYHWKGCPHGV